MGNDIIHSIRDFNRFYTAILGVVNHHILESEYSLTEARVIYELHSAAALTARELKEMLQIDEGYLSRIITKFVKNGILRKKQVKSDKRAYLLELTAKGNKVFEAIDQQSDVQVAHLIEHLGKAEQKKLVELVTQVKALLTRE
ncbi:MarR family winged helix-turn-helix transcriptional regulator [Chitinophaga japonensis]|uniref:DNA-binding MarR family transcriptional regulator n=1 Tax=Chitinophaga japonensis TaxID=104662 RepID=A0A562TCP4_CHIJA|nr:MarR family winged helix-turn-helix transcriptional regulator [Chitinophaga japonensis]TWI91289.1 DNA-binding MarR family transcriptional regulator [Chitinophaga japonensis]